MPTGPSPHAAAAAARLGSAARWLWAFVLAGSLVVCPAAAQTSAEVRVAVVIGNAAYPAAALVNPTNDAKAVSAALKAMGFTVFEVRDASKAQMQAAIAQAGNLLTGRNGVGVLYYAGHGLQLDWHNYLVPVDARVTNAAEVQEQAVNIQLVIDTFRIAGNRLSILVLDACRDNPFAGGASGKGLAQMDAPPGTLVAYATAPGKVAEDGDAGGGNGLYTHHLVRELKQPGVKVEDVFKRVRLQVRKQSAGRQVPWESTSLEDDFYFDPTVRVVTLAEAERASLAAQSLLRERADWAGIEESTEPGDYVAFLDRYPKGELHELVELRLGELLQLHARAPHGVAVVLPNVRNRFATGDTLEYDWIDGYTKVARRIGLRVTYADDERVEFNRGQLVMTQLGGVVRDLSGHYEPARLDAPAELAVGKKWRSEYTTGRPGGQRFAAHCNYKVVALEDVTVPAGTFKAFKVERAGESSAMGLPTLTGTEWIDPATMLTVRLDTLTRVRGGIADFYSLHLVSVTRVPRRGVQ